MAKQQEISQPTRVLILALNSLVFYGLYRWSSGVWEISGGGKSLWFVSGISLWLLNLIAAPWFQPPRDNLGTGIVAIILLVAIDLSTVPSPMLWISVLKWSGFSLAVLAVLVSVLAIVGQAKFSGTAFSRGAYGLSRELGRGEVLLTPPALIGIYGFYPNLPSIQAVLAATWFIFVLMRPFELITAGLRFLSQAGTNSDKDQCVGRVVRIDDPGIIRVALLDQKQWQKDKAYVAELPNNETCYLLPLSTQIQEDRVLGTGIKCGTAVGLNSSPRGNVFLVEEEGLANSLVRTISGVDDDCDLIGFVVEGSQISTIRFELSERIEIEEGAVVFANVGNKIVYYQLLDAVTAEEKFQENPHGTQIVLAAQIGTLGDKGNFEKFPWLPQMNQPIFRTKEPLSSDAKLTNADFLVGKLPSTNIQVTANLEDLIAHHAAILGATGTGKTELALDIIRQAFKCDTKVFCVDFTGEYSARLADLKPREVTISPEKYSEFEQKVFAVETGEYGAPKEKKALNEFLGGVRQDIEAQIHDFLLEEGGSLAICGLADVEVVPHCWTGWQRS